MFRILMISLAALSLAACQPKTATQAGDGQAQGPVAGDQSKASKDFLAKIGDGRTISKYRKSEKVFSQGDIADSVFYIQMGKVKVTVVSEHGGFKQERWSPIPAELCGASSLLLPTLQRRR